MVNSLSSIFNIIFLLTMILSFRCSFGSDFLHSSCKKAAKSDRSFSYNFCVESLKANPKSQTARSIEELFIISFELTISNASEVASYVSKLLKDKKFDGYARGCLHDCLELYSDAVYSLKEALRDYIKSKDLSNANVEISAALDASTTCEDGFKERKVSLQAVPASHVTNLQGLALIAMELALDNATNTISIIKQLLTNETADPFALECLKDCLEVYSEAVTMLVDSIAGFLEEHYDTARVWLSAVMEVATTCADGFKEKEGVVYPLENENYSLFQLSDIALCITHLLSQVLHSLELNQAFDHIQPSTADERGAPALSSCSITCWCLILEAGKTEEEILHSINFLNYSTGRKDPLLAYESDKLPKVFNISSRELKLPDSLLLALVNSVGKSSIVVTVACLLLRIEPDRGNPYKSSEPYSLLAWLSVPCGSSTVSVNQSEGELIVGEEPRRENEMMKGL
ncbi:hypothetical protein FEM48_Zijuj11G0078000 [Ziziphus jujuba var. spinosa]|uniref:Pectinesterase inhibitor domain-containing protein n=1 Tax=Ziziphus jujuba var. spinosa TaxID=714518 RepID=A0A978UHQ5_ZIZJJ|nr:hypothetical protein FEM48_Zijuj11G0078000 [Ziziphus jujuba var. spinosa]